jgi:hypothetical protein
MREERKERKLVANRDEVWMGRVDEEKESAESRPLYPIPHSLRTVVPNRTRPTTAKEAMRIKGKECTNKDHQQIRGFGRGCEEENKRTGTLDKQLPLTLWSGSEGNRGRSTNMINSGMNGDSFKIATRDFRDCSSFDLEYTRVSQLEG